MREQYMVGGEGFLLVYAINSRNSFTEVREFHEQILRVKDVEKFPIVVVGNKCDLGDRQRKVTKDEGQQLCDQLGVPFFETSAKSAINVEESFYQIVREIRGSGKKPKAAGGKRKCAIL
jgi:GTPase KRas protein